ncbi:long-chain fatty acid transport protein 4-like [Dendronephthya gigantea]|uniref:long-chain fatty acid transport protein 4-like n=1 Tax=Dendronephthya gigantea TaxID=151771 RepID=UPI00106C74EF|nr:long-chain fatty acid transport protein 4-like [Dendronephthya gigantea]
MAYRLAVGLALLAVQVAWLKFTWLLACSITFCLYLVSGGWRFVRLLWLTFPRDLRGAIFQWKVASKIRQYSHSNNTVCDIFQMTAEKHRDKVAFVFEDKYWTFQEVEYFSNKVANYFQSIGYKKGDVVALFMENRPELVFFWLGLAKIGVISALVNYNLRKESLSHSISIVNAKGLIYSNDLIIVDAVTDISPNVELYEFDVGGISSSLKSKNILEEFKECSKNPPPLLDEKKFDDVVLYIYTSGTTGLPKASIIKHSRFLRITTALTTLLQIIPNDVIYCVLPLYHTSAGVVGVGAVISNGATLVVRRKLSASRFWDECIEYKATIAIYIGELCRYILAQPPKESDKKHKLRLMTGNGLRPQIWNQFKTRFNIPFIFEFYGATESNVSSRNVDGYPGAIGSLPVIASSLSPTATRLFKIDPLSGELARNSDGLAIPCNPGEVGQIAGRINNRKVLSRFDGYVNKQATQKKIAHDLLKKGDEWFLSGDVLYWDELGYLFFHDRLGDTFRWRGENVSTSEVEGVMANALGLNSVVVYGVQIPGCEGRAGMAAIEDPDDVIDVKFISSKLPEVLPSYARPVFLRVTNVVDTTGTFKFQKTRFRKEGFDFSIVKDKLFFLDSKLGEYCVLTAEIHGKIVDGDMRF